jgi:hypothetical protein
VNRVRADPHAPNDFADEAPTDVRELADLMSPMAPKPETASDPLPGLKGWGPDISTPPGGWNPRVPRLPRKLK